jgi:hypothetical protein
MKAGVIVGSALAGAAAAAVITLDEKEKEKVMDFLGNIKDKVVDLAEELKDKLPGSVKDIMPESLGVSGAVVKVSKAVGMGNSRVAQSVKGSMGGKAKGGNTKTKAKTSGRSRSGK